MADELKLKSDEDEFEVPEDEGERGIAEDEDDFDEEEDLDEEDEEETGEDRGFSADIGDDRSFTAEIGDEGGSQGDMETARELPRVTKGSEATTTAVSNEEPRFEDRHEGGGTEGPRE